MAGSAPCERNTTRDDPSAGEPAIARKQGETHGMSYGSITVHPLGTVIGAGPGSVDRARPRHRRGTMRRAVIPRRPGTTDG